MKFLAITFLLIGFFSPVATAQNSVEITQKGKGNTATIHQSSRTDRKVDIPCAHIQKDSTDLNLIVLKSSNSNKRDSLYVSSSGINTFKQAGSNNEIKAMQHGRDNKLYVQLHDTITGKKRLLSKQKGSSNLIKANIKDSSHVSLSQNGSNNFILISPCDTDP